MMGDAADALEDWEDRQQRGGTWDRPAAPFVIDTGPAFSPLRDRLPDWFLDQQPDSATDAQLAFTYARWLIEETRRPKKLETVRKHLLAAWWALPIIADHHPTEFDEILCAFALRVEGIEG